MSEKPQEYWPHPLLPWLENIVVNAPHPVMVPFAPQGSFQRVLESAGAIHPMLAEDEVQKNILLRYRHANVLSIALASGGGSYLSGLELHALLYTAADADPYAAALCDAAAYAWHCGVFPAFAVSTRLPGFLDALVAWARHFERDKPFHGPDRLKYVNRDLVQTDHPAAGYWLEACKKGFDSPKDFLRASAKETALFDDAEDKRKERAAKAKKGHKPKPPPRFKDSIEFGWIPLALWARTNQGILTLLEPGVKHEEKKVNRVKRDISTLGFSASRCVKWEEILTKAERAAKDSSNS